MGIIPVDMYISQDHTLPEDRKYKLIPKKFLQLEIIIQKILKSLIINF